MATRLELLEQRGSMLQRDSGLDISTLLINDNSFLDVGEEDLKRKQTVHIWLRPIDMETEQYHHRETRSRCPAGIRPGQWLLDLMTFKEWFDPRYTAPPTLLWLHGNPGAGM